jgi:hypothetical protein
LLAQESRPGWLAVSDVTKEYGEAGWGLSPLVHFDRAAVTRNAPGKNKSDLMMPFLAGASR